MEAKITAAAAARLMMDLSAGRRGKPLRGRSVCGGMGGWGDVRGGRVWEGKEGRERVWEGEEEGREWEEKKGGECVFEYI